MAANLGSIELVGRDPAPVKPGDDPHAPRKYVYTFQGKAVDRSRLADLISEYPDMAAGSNCNFYEGKYAMYSEIDGWHIYGEG